MTDFGTFHVRDFSVCYYLDRKKKWVYGDLGVTVEEVNFYGKICGEEYLQVRIKYSDIADVKKTTTSFVFGAVVIVLKDGHKHWFSSLPCRETVHNSITYFMRGNLLLQSKSTVINKQQDGRTEMGRKLLKVAVDSHNTMLNAAEALNSQGTQIDSAITNMDELHNDLDVAENLILGMEKWLGKWRLPKVYHKIDPYFVSREDIPDMKELEVLFTKMETNRMSAQELGLFRISQDGLYILTQKQKLVQHFKWKDISRIRVLSPCEIIVTKYLIGQPDLSIDIVCTSLMEILQFLEKQLKSKMEYMTEGFVRSDKFKARQTPTTQAQQLKRDKDCLLQSESVRPVPDGTQKVHVINSQNQESQHSTSSGAIQGVQSQKTKEIVSDSEVQELQQTLADLRSLAMNVQQETDIQNEKLDKLSGTVEKANVRIAENNKRVKKLT